MPEISKRKLTAAELAEHLGLNVQTVWKWARQGRIPHVRMGRTVRFSLEEVEAAMAEEAARAA